MLPYLKLAWKISGKLPRLWMGRPIPLYCQWDVTLRCNLQCRHCILSYTGHPRIRELDTEGALKMIRDLKKAGAEIIYFWGGEPTLREDLGELLKEIKRLSMLSIVATNGQLIPETLGALKEAAWVRVSVNGNKETHDELCRKPGAWDKAVAGIKLLRREGVSVGVNCVVTRQMPRDALATLVREVSDRSVLVDFSPIGTDLCTVSEPGPADLRQEVESMRIPMEDFIKTVERLRQEFGGVVTNPFMYRLLQKEGGLAGLGCRVMNTSISIRPDGSYSFPCCDFPVRGVGGEPKTALNSQAGVEARKRQGTYWFCRQCYSRCMVMPSLLLNPWRIMQILITYSRSVVRSRSGHSIIPGEADGGFKKTSG